MTDEPMKSLPNDVFATLQQQLKKQPSSSASAALLQMQLAQVKQLNKENGADVVSAPVGEQYLTFLLHDLEFAVKAEVVQGVERLSSLTPVPNVVSWVKGVMNLRGVITSVVDFRAFLGLESLPHTARTRLLSLQYNEMVICFMVDGVNEMLAIPPGSMRTGRQAAIPSWVAPYASGVASVGSRGIVVIDVARLLFSEKIHHYEI